MKSIFCFTILAFFLAVNCKLFDPLRAESMKSDIIGALNCMVRFYDTHMNGIHPASTNNVNIVTLLRSEYQDMLLRSLSNYEKYSTLQIQSNDSKIESNLKIISKIAKYIVFVFYARDVEQNILLWKSTSSWNPSAQTFVILRTFNDKRRTELEMRRIFQVFHQYNMWHVFVVSTDFDNQNIFMQGWFPYESKNCGNKTDDIEEIDSCSYKFNDTFTHLDKIKTKRLEWQNKWRLNDLNRCPIKVLANIYKPFVIHSTEVSSLNQNKRFFGIEIFIVNLIAYKLNMTLDVRTDYRNRNSKKNGAMTDIMQPILNGYFDLKNLICRRY